MAKENSENNGSWKGKIGLFMALAFYIVSVVMVIINTKGSSFIDGDAETITIAHWQLEDGFRQGFDEAIKRYEKMMKEKGRNVRIVQTTVPVRGYSQWFITQLISGDPADIIELSGASQLHNQYFVPLSGYIGNPNPYNKGTPLQGIPWKDTYIDGMNSALDSTYAEYFGVGTFFHVMRVYVNKDLLKKATGSDKMPKTLDEWLDDCKKLREYGLKNGIPIIPIGVRGFDKGTLASLFQQYFSQLNGHLNDVTPQFGSQSTSTYEVLSKLADEKLNIEQLLAPIDIVKQLGMNFGEGFSATDLEQTKFLFNTGNVGFFPEGTWNAWSMVKSSPFEVEVINIPIIGSRNQYYNYFTGETSEVGVGVGGRFGITKASKHFDLALDFMQYLTSYKINQLTMMEYCKWPPAVINAKYEGLLEKFKPREGDARLTVSSPFYLSKKSRTRTLEAMERIIVRDIPNPKEYFWQEFTTNILPIMEEEVTEALNSSERQLFDIEGQRSCTGVGSLVSDLNKMQKKTLERRYAMNMENLTSRCRQRYLIKRGLVAFDKLLKNGQNMSVDTNSEEVK
jgi:raffinose/stachyose/melibiose transport system substrate-binding protein